MGKIRIVVADDHLIIREGLRLIAETSEDVDLVGEAANGFEALQVVRKTTPDVILLDLRMPGMHGLEALERLRDEAPGVAVVVLTTYNEDELMARALAAGVHGYLLKDATRETLLETLRAAAEGRILLAPDMVARAMAHTMRASSMNDTGVSDLTERERETLAGVARGERSKEIARRMGITERTVKAHLAHIFEKLGVDSRASAVAVALRRGLLDRG